MAPRSGLTGALAIHPSPDGTVDSPTPESAETEHDAVVRLLGREPQGPYEVVVARADGSPVVLANGPFLDSGRPMPTRFWLIDRKLVKAIGRLESTGAVDRAEAAVDPAALQAAHDAYGAERDALIPAGHTGPRPYGGVGGTRVGVKCLHAHYANHLVGAVDPVGDWVAEQLAASGNAYDSQEPA